MNNFNLAEFELEDWLPVMPWAGPPLPRFLGIFWPWYEAAPPEGIYCPYCGAGPFSTIDEANEHIKAEHPGMPLLIEIVWT